MSARGNQARGPRTDDARSVAARVVLAVWRRGALAASELDAQLAARPTMQRRDRALCTELVYGVLRTHGALDARLNELATRVIDDRLRVILWVAGYQLWFLDRIPPFAVVHEAVEQARAVGGNKPAGFVNAVLRRLARERGRMNLPQAIRASTPEWLLAALEASVGREQAAWLLGAVEASAAPGAATPDSVVAEGRTGPSDATPGDAAASGATASDAAASNAAASDATPGDAAVSGAAASDAAAGDAAAGDAAAGDAAASGAAASDATPGDAAASGATASDAAASDATASGAAAGGAVERLAHLTPTGVRWVGNAPQPPWYRDAPLGRLYPRSRRLLRAGNLQATAEYRAGHFVVQEEGAAFAGAAVGARAGERVLDACAGTGQKSTLLAEALGSQGCLWVTDCSGKKLQRLSREFERLRLPEPRTAVVDWTSGAPGSVPRDFQRILLDAPCTGTGTLRRRPEIMLRLTPEDADRHAQNSEAMLRRLRAHLLPGARLVFVVCSVLRRECEEVVERVRELYAPIAFDAPFAPLQGQTALRLLPGVHGTDGFFIASLTPR